MCIKTFVNASVFEDTLNKKINFQLHAGSIHTKFNDDCCSYVEIIVFQMYDPTCVNVKYPRYLVLNTLLD